MAHTFLVTIQAESAESAESILAGCDDGIRNVEPHEECDTGGHELSDHFTYWEFQGLTALVEMRIVEAQNEGDAQAVASWNALLEKLNGGR